MTVEWFDLAQRLAAARTGRVVERLAHAPFPEVAYPVAVRARVHGEQVSVTACAPGAVAQTRRGADALRLLSGLGVQISADHWRTLITDDTATLPALSRLAHGCGRDGPLADVAAHVGWWLDRADFPGTSALVALVPACQTRWIPGCAPGEDKDAETWRTWIGITDHGCPGLHELLALVGDGPTLPGLDSIVRDDAYAFQRATAEHADGWDWRAPDTISRAASGLRSRCDTADLWAAALLADPLFRRRAVHTGHVVCGTATVPANTKNKLQVTCDRMDARLRTGSQIVGWAGGPAVPGNRFSATVTSTGVNAAGRLVLNLGTVTTATQPATGQRVTLMGAPPNEHAASAGRRRYRALYSTRSSWLTTGRTPVPQRRDVPLDVLIAGAGDD